jgi:hypothetical protein
MRKQMKILPITIKTGYGRRIVGRTPDKEYIVHIAEDTQQIYHKLYYIKKMGEWVKSKLIYFKDNKIEKVITSEVGQ